MNLYEQFSSSTHGGVTLGAEDLMRVDIINGKIKGWSDGKHYAFFRALLEQPVHSILILGVYHGRDIAFLLDILERFYPGRDIRIVGVDRFTADPCADWAITNKIRTWEEEANSPPPDYALAQANTRDPRVTIIKSDDFTFLDTTEKKFDVIYFDTAHDFNTLIRQLRQASRVCKGDAILCGDDFSDQYTWGVKAAVMQSLNGHISFADWIWVSSKSLLKT